MPYIDKIGIGMPPEYMTADQRFAARRPDVLVYETDVLDEDVTLAGPIDADLHVSTTGTDSDWIVKLIDVYPDDYPDPNPNPTGVRMGGYQQLVRGDVMRGKFRNSFEKPEPFTPGKPTAVKFTLPDVCHTFRTRPPDHGAGAEQLVPAGGPQPADVRGHRQREGVRLPEGDAAGLSVEGTAVAAAGGRASLAQSNVGPVLGLAGCVQAGPGAYDSTSCGVSSRR